MGTRLEVSYVIATEGDEVQTALVLIADWFDVHLRKLSAAGRPSLPQKAREGWGNPIPEFFVKA